ncbi:biotin carboxylase N-terminal domain-containing protein [Smaragdicoccus niigatensis]|uniref:ATP-binding protein n=1 Tax=Smaragdicoccus niigatensis TaxID=359359 RepID=UPI000376A7B7|nr:biotin carboxylase N-terminal domain-containing protein [Smaragdicoccus niigatensis]
MNTIQKIAIVNRGEPAVRLIRAVRELNAARNWSIRTVALHTEAERRALFVRQADEACLLRPTGSGTPYLDHAELGRALRQSGADAVWVGWGFVAEDPAFAEMCARMGITFIGPSADAMRLLGDKVAAKILAEKVGVPVAPWSGGPVENRADARRHAQAIGYPLIIKARSGGGGRGIRKVYSEDQLEVGLDRTMAEAERSFGDPVVFLERLVTDARHVEVQIIADQHGNVWAPGVRDCSIQRKNQKVIEESSSPVLTQEQSDYLRFASSELVHAAGYVGAGTVEYLYQPDQQIFTFLEVNTRLQVEHPITEAATGVDLVKLQILIANGEPLPGACPPEIGHAVEARLNAEDPDNDFAAAPGKVVHLNFPMGPGIRVDSGIAQGDVIPPDYDSMVAKIIASGRDRDEALARLRTALQATQVVLDGGTTNKSFLLELLDRPELIDGSADTGWLDRQGPRTVAPSRVAHVALIAAAIEFYDSQQDMERDSFLRSARGGRPRTTHAMSRDVELSYQGQAYTLAVAQTGPTNYRINVADNELEASIERLGAFGSRITLGNTHYQVVLANSPGQFLVEVDNITHRVSRDDGGIVRAPAPAVVVAVPAAAGDTVEVGDTLVVLEAMKMEMAVRAPWPGVVRDVLAVVNSQIDAGAPLLRMNKKSEGAAVSTAPRVVFPRAESEVLGDTIAEAGARLDTLRSVITGFDVDAKRAVRVLSEYWELRSSLAEPSAALLEAEVGLIATFADICEISRNRPAADEDTEVLEEVHSPREGFHSFLLTLDPEIAGLKPAFTAKLAGALGHYGADLTPGPDLESAVYRLFLGLQRIENQVPVIAGLLERWLARDAAAPRPTPALAEVLDRLIGATQIRFPLISDVARLLRFRAFSEPVIKEARFRAYRNVRRGLDYLSANPDAVDYTDRVQALAESTEPLLLMLGQRIASPGPLVEVLTRQYYRIHTLADVTTVARGDHGFVTGTFDLAGERMYLAATAASFDDFGTVLDHVAELPEDVAAGAGHNLGVDIYVSWPDAPLDGDAVSAELVRRANSHTSALNVRRITITVFGARNVAFQITLRPGDNGFTEDRIIRDMHPMTAQRFDFWRLKEFEGRRLSAPADTHLYELTARNNAKDQRLHAFAEVREEDVQRDASGAVISVPGIERAIAACVDGLRRAQTQRHGKRLENNRVAMFVWPVLDIPESELSAIGHIIAPITYGAGLEQVRIRLRVRPDVRTEPRDVSVRVSFSSGAGLVVSVTEPPSEALRPLDEYTLKVHNAKMRGLVYPYELVPMLTGEDGRFVEYDLNESGTLVPIDRPRGRNSAGVIVGLTTKPTMRYPEGMTRVAMFGDPTKALGTVAEAECSRIIAALDLATERQLPVEWFALSSGATISMDSGTENMDWVAKALRRIVQFTQAGGTINVVVAGINVGAQPYWNAEATMLAHTKGILVMTPDSAMVLTGKRSLDYSGGVSAEDNFGIGGYDRVMGPNGEAQYWVPNLKAACDLLLEHYEHSYVAPGERFPRRAFTKDPINRDVNNYPHVHPSSDFTTVGEIFSPITNGDRKKPFDIRTVMRSIVDQDHRVMERWADMAGAETSVVFDAHLAGHPVVLIGIESRPISRKGWYPADGPDSFTSGTLFPHSSKKTARAINAASGNRPVVVLANLSGFDGSPESLRKLQLEYGAEIGRAVVNFDGPIVFCLISRYHGGAFVVFSGALNDNMEVIAVEGSFASVIGGAPAAAVVFTREVDKRVASDPDVLQLEAELAEAKDDAERARVRVALAEVRSSVRSVKLGEVAAEFEAIHNIDRAQRVGSVHTIVAAETLRPSLAEAIERGQARTLAAKKQQEHASIS